MSEDDIECLRRQVEDLKAELLRLHRGPGTSANEGSSPPETDALRRSEAALRRNETLLNATQRLSKVGGWEWNIEKQTMYWTEETYRLHDLAPVALIPGSSDHLVSSLACCHPKDRQTILQAFKRCAGQGDAYDLEFPFTTAAGRKLWIRTTAQPTWEDGRMVSVVGTIMDITERIKAAEEIAKIEEQNRQLQKAESLGRMAGAIAHRFNNLLGVVLGNLEMITGVQQPGTDAAENLAEAIQAAHRAAEVSGLMLTYLGQTRARADMIDLSETCRRSLPMLRAAMPKDVLLKPELPSHGPVIRANANQIQQVMTNICTNAWEAVGSSRGTVELSVKVVAREEIPATHRFPLDWQPQDNAYACLEIMDSGCGIAGKDIEKIFDPFFSSKLAGRGLGLPVVLGVVKAYRGTVAVESKPGKGSIFRVYFPLPSEEVPLPPDKSDKALPIEPGGAVLLVEDDAMLRKLTKAVLKGLGFEVIPTGDGTEAVEAFRQRQGEIRFVLCDLSMPRMDGWETLEALKKLSPETPVILTSGFDEARVMAGDHLALPDAFLSKPYERNELIEVIGKIVSTKISAGQAEG